MNVPPRCDDGTPMVDAAELMRRSGASYRQIDYWTRCGLLPGLQHGAGSGKKRWYSAVAVERAVVLEAISQADVYRMVAEDPDSEGRWVHEGAGVRITIERVRKPSRRKAS